MDDGGWSCRPVYAEDEETVEPTESERLRVYMVLGAADSAMDASELRDENSDSSTVSAGVPIYDVD